VRALIDAIERQRVPTMFLVLLAVSITVGVMAGSRAQITIRSILYTLVLANALLIVYTLLLRNMVLGVLAYLYAATFLRYYWRILIPGQLPDLDVPRLVFVAVWIVFLLEIMVAGRRLLPRTNIEVWMLLLVAALILSMAYMGQTHIRNFLNGYAAPYAMFVVAKNVFRTQKDVDRLVYWMAVPLSLYFPLTLIFEHYDINALVFPRYIVTGEVAGQSKVWGFRSVGPFMQPVATGFAAVAMFVLSLYGLARMRGMLPRVILLFIALVTPVGIFFTYTRNVYLSFFAVMVILVGFSKRLKRPAALILIMMVLGVMANWDNVKTEKREEGGLATTGTIQQRLVLVDASSRMFIDRPFIGVGFNRYAEEADQYVGQVRSTILGYREAWMGKHIKQHNQFLNMATELGLSGLVPLLLIYYYVIRALYKARSIDSPTYDREFVVAVWAIFAAYLVNVMFMEPRFFEFMNVFPFLIAGIVVGGAQRAKQGYSNNGTSERSARSEGTVCGSQGTA
jgi:O-antigen ligase